MYGIYKNHLANFSVEFSLQSIPSIVIERAKLLFMDSFVAVVSGTQTSIARSLSKNFSSLSSTEASHSNSSISLNDRHHSFLFSALTYGFSMVCQELDEGNPKAKGHPACHFFPALLAEAERNKTYSGTQILEAFIIGYEINARAGAAITLKKDIHPHGSWGLIGGGYAFGKLNNYTSEEYDSMLALTSSLPFISLWNPIFEGEQIRDLMIGLNNLHLLLLPAMVNSGISSSLKNLETIYSSILGNSVDHTKLAEGIGERYDLMSSYFKFHPFCRFCHSPMEGVKQLIEEEQIPIDSIEKININTYEAASRLNHYNPVNEYAGKFSIPHAVSSFLQKEYGKTIESSQIEVREDLDLTNLLPDIRASVIDIYLKNGEKKQLKVHHASGDSNDESLKEQVLLKNRNALSEVIGQQKAEAVIEQLLALDSADNFLKIIKMVG